MELFLKFIKQEEEYFHKLSTETNIEIPKKITNFQKTIIINDDSNKDINNINNKFIWLKNHCLSCRYDSFF